MGAFDPFPVMEDFTGEMNISRIFGDHGFFFDVAVDSEIENFQYELESRGIDDDEIQELLCSIDVKMGAFAETAPDYVDSIVGALSDEWLEVFQLEFAEIGNDIGGWGVTPIYCRVTFDAYRAAEMLRERGITELDDGRDIPGFFRTAHDVPWIVAEVMRIAAEEHHDDLMNSGVETFCDIAGELIDIPAAVINRVYG
jgi:hypothetical protein